MNRTACRLAGLLLTVALLGGCTTFPASYGTVQPSSQGALIEIPLAGDQATGVAVSAQGRIFLTFPRWDKDPLYSVAELLPDGTLVPYPDTGWNRWGKDESTHPEAHFVCVQSVTVDADDNLWILDPASPGFTGGVPGGAKLIKVNLATNTVERVIHFSDSEVPRLSYLNDLRIGPEGRFVYITDSGVGAIVVIDLKTGRVVRRLEGSPSTKAESGYVPVIDGRELRGPDGKVPQINADGIALDSAGEYLYYHALVAKTLYRIRTAYLKDFSMPEDRLATHVEKVADTGAVDGMIMGFEDNLYLTALEDHAVKRYRPDSDILETVVRDDRLQWPDSLAIAPDGNLYVTASQINLMPRFNFGKDKRTIPYRLFRTLLVP